MRGEGNICVLLRQYASSFCFMRGDTNLCVFRTFLNKIKSYAMNSWMNQFHNRLI